MNHECDEGQAGTARFARHVAGLSLGSAVPLFALGIVAVALPRAVDVGVAALVAGILIAGALVHWIFANYAFAAEKPGYGLWRFLVAAVYVVVGIYLASHPALGLSMLTPLIGALLMSEGVLRLVAFFLVRARCVPGSGWILFDAVMNLVLGAAFVAGWPRDSAPAIATIVGLSLFMSGFTRIKVSLAARRAAFAGGAP